MGKQSPNGVMLIEGREWCGRQGLGKKGFMVHPLPAVVEESVEGFGEVVVEGVERKRSVHALPTVDLEVALPLAETDVPDCPQGSGRVVPLGKLM